MTNKEKKALSSWNIKITAERDERDKRFKSLQDLCIKYEMPAYCSAHANLLQLLTNNFVSPRDTERAIKLFDEFCTYQGRNEALRELLTTL